AAADVDPMQSLRRAEPVEKFCPGQLAPATHQPLIGFAVGEKIWRFVHGHYSAAFGVPRAWIAAQTRFGVAGMSMRSTPSGFNASRTAPMTAGGAPVAPASPAPLTPSGLVFAGTSVSSETSSGKSSARGIA